MFCFCFVWFGWSLCAKGEGGGGSKIQDFCPGYRTFLNLFFYDPQYGIFLSKIQDFCPGYRTFLNLFFFMIHSTVFFGPKYRIFVHGIELPFFLFYPFDYGLVSFSCQ